VSAPHEPDADELRALVREVLREALPNDLAGSGPRSAGDVQVLDGADLDALVRRVAGMCADPDVRADLASGELRFRLSGAARADPPADDRPALRVERGAVTERHVKDAARDGARLVVGRSAVLTPLARDRARTLGVDVETER
jgi:hypothetical protein